MNEALTITGAIFALLAALYFQRKDVADLKSDMVRSIDAMRADTAKSLDSLKAEISDFKSEVRAGFAHVNGRIDQVNVRIDRMQGDINTFATVNALHDHRIMTLETAAKT